MCNVVYGFNNGSKFLLLLKLVLNFTVENVIVLVEKLFASTEG